MLPLALAVLATMAPAGTRSVAAMAHERRVVIVSASAAADPSFSAQCNALAGWRGAGSRDVTVVSVAGTRVEGASDTAAGLRRAYRLPADRFALVLIGKDGHVALRSAEPVSADRLQDTIDAMPMRRVGGCARLAATRRTGYVYGETESYTCGPISRSTKSCSRRRWKRWGRRPSVTR